MSTAFFSTYWPSSVGPAAVNSSFAKNTSGDRMPTNATASMTSPKPGEHARDEGESGHGLDDRGEDERELAADHAEGQHAPRRLDERLERAHAGEELDHAEGDEHGAEGDAKGGDAPALEERLEQALQIPDTVEESDAGDRNRTVADGLQAGSGGGDR